MVEKNTHSSTDSVDPSIEELFQLIGDIPDPEIPVINIRELGILQKIEKSAEGYRVVITPTYSACPAMDMITAQIRLTLAEKGWSNVKIVEQLSPAWTTDWMTEVARIKLNAYGIAPPNRSAAMRCPNCNSLHIQLVSQFGSTACKALYRCEECKEPFDYFKCH